MSQRGGDGGGLNSIHMNEDAEAEYPIIVYQITSSGS
jgi:hypothetical protein